MNSTERLELLGILAGDGDGDGDGVWMGGGGLVRYGFVVPQISLVMYILIPRLTIKCCADTKY